jgi:hypothetical protein
VTAVRGRVLTAEAAQALQDESDRNRELLTWVVMVDEVTAEAIARPIAPGRSALPCVLLAATLDDLHGQLPAGLTWSPWPPADPPNVVEVWYAVGRQIFCND